MLWGHPENHNIIAFQWRTAVVWLELRWELRKVWCTILGSFNFSDFVSPGPFHVKCMYKFLASVHHLIAGSPAMRLRSKLSLCGAALGVWAISGERRRKSQELSLSVGRAWRAAACAGRIAFRYKRLGWDPAVTVLARSKAHEECAQLALQMCRCNGGIFVKMGCWMQLSMHFLNLLIRRIYFSVSNLVSLLRLKVAEECGGMWLLDFIIPFPKQKHSHIASFLNASTEDNTRPLWRRLCQRSTVRL